MDSVRMRYGSGTEAILARSSVRGRRGRRGKIVCALRMQYERFRIPFRYGMGAALMQYGCGTDVVRMRHGYGMDVARMRQGCGAERYGIDSVAVRLRYGCGTDAARMRYAPVGTALARYACSTDAVRVRYRCTRDAVWIRHPRGSWPLGTSCTNQKNERRVHVVKKIPCFFCCFQQVERSDLE